MLLDKLISDISRTITLCSATLGKAFMSFFSSLSALLELYNLYSVFTEKAVGQRNTKLGTYFLGLGINVFYTIAVITGKFLNYLGLGLFGLGAELVALIRASYILHESRVLTKITKKALNQLVRGYNPLYEDAHQVFDDIKKLQKNLADQRDFRFKNKVDTGYNVIAVVVSGIFIAGLCFPPLIAASFVMFAIFKSLQAYDTYHNYKFNRWLSSTWDALLGEPVELIEPLVPEPNPLVVGARPSNVSSLSTASIIRQTLLKKSSDNEANGVEVEQMDEESHALLNAEKSAEPNLSADKSPHSDADTSVESEAEKSAEPNLSADKSPHSGADTSAESENESEDDLDLLDMPLLEKRRMSM